MSIKVKVISAFAGEDGNPVLAEGQVVELSQERADRLVEAGCVELLKPESSEEKKARIKKEKEDKELAEIEAKEKEEADRKDREEEDKKNAGA